jgi:hypothetical protein
MAGRLGLDPATAHALLAAAERQVGRRALRVRAAAFAVATQPALARVLPAGLRRRAIVAFAGPLLDAPAARNAYGAGRTELLGVPGAGLLRRP